MISSKLKKIWFGGDYNPEQWPAELMEEDMRLFNLAGIDAVSVNVFGWGRIQPHEDRYEFEWLDRVMDRLYEQEIVACLGTATVVYPSWMGRKYPDLQRVDFQGRKRKYGGRANFCPNSPSFRRFASELVKRLVERYRDHPALAAWHVSNEYNGLCYCENCEQAFRVWLQRRYRTFEQLNEAWSLSFWNHFYYDWEDIVSPTETTVYWGEAKSGYSGMSLDYMRFQSDSLLDCFIMERDILRGVTPEVPITTNFMRWKGLDYRRWAQEMDVVSFDNYPRHGSPSGSNAIWHDIMRSLKGGQPFMLLEQAPNYAQWMDYNPPKRPGVMRLQSYQAMAHGADTVMYFQLRQSRGAGEKLHGAVIGHAGHEHTRTFREVASLGEELQQLGDLVNDSHVEAGAAILFDWENWWAAELCVGPSKDINYFEQVQKYYQALYERNIAVDFIHPEDDFTKYAFIAAPMLYMVKDGLTEKLTAFVERGGTFVTTFFSGMVDANDRIELGGYPGKLRQLLGIWVEESDILEPDATDGSAQYMVTMDGQHHACALMCDVIHLEGAESVATFARDYYEGGAAVTRHRVGSGEAWYIGTDPEEAWLTQHIGDLAERSGAEPVMQTPDGVEVTRRIKGEQHLTFVLNHRAEEVGIDLEGDYLERLSGNRVSGPSVLPPYGVWILTK